MFLTIGAQTVRMPGGTYLRGDQLTLRTVTEADYTFVHEHWNDPESRDGMPVPTPFSPDEIAAFVQEDASVQFLPCRDGDPVGMVFLLDVHEARSHAELGYWIVPDARGEGYATEAARLCLDHAFRDRGLHKVFARVLAGNEASMRVLETLRFEREGRLREHEYVRGEHRDAVLFGLLAEEYDE